MGQSLNNLAVRYLNQGKYAQAEPLLQRSLAIREKGLGPEHPDVAQSLNNLAELYRTQGKYAEAEPLFKRSLGIWEESLGPEHPQVATGLNNLAELYRTQGKYAQAGPLYKRALAISEKALGPDHPSLATSLNNLPPFPDVAYLPGESPEGSRLGRFLCGPHRVCQINVRVFSRRYRNRVFTQNQGDLGGLPGVGARMALDSDNRLGPASRSTLKVEEVSPWPRASPAECTVSTRPSTA